MTTAMADLTAILWRSRTGRREHDLPCDDQGHVQFPDVRIEYDIDGRDHTLDVEVMTPHYRGAHAAAKSGSGFRLYFSARSRWRTRRWPDAEHHRGVAAMTFDERVQAVAKKGFTERQARFLTTVMLHAGVCVPRQYARFCGIVYGAKTRKFFAKLVRLQYASMYDCRHNRARIYHVNQRALYAAIGEADSRLRKPVTLNHAIQRLMVLDAIVEDPDLVWLGTAEEKAAHLMALTRIEAGDLPHVTVGEGELAPCGTSRTACRSASISPAAAWSSTSSPTPGWTSSACSSCATPRCSGRCRHGRSGSSCRRSSRTSVSGRNRSSGIS